jgi:hypothetical protein
MNMHSPSSMTARIVIAAVLGVGSMLAGRHAVAADRLLLVGAEAADAAYYSYVGALVPFGERKDGHGWYQRYWVDAFGYEYDGGPGRVEADAYGVEAALGYGGSDELGWWSVRRARGAASSAASCRSTSNAGWRRTGALPASPRTATSRTGTGCVDASCTVRR